MWGSSPLTRGKRGRAASAHICGRLIPAHAGKTVTVLPQQSSQPGSSPLTRGKHPPRPRAARRRGLIPAHAGKTGGQVPALAGFGAHPRSRGENRWAGTRARGLRGSSPLTRGKPLPIVEGQLVQGLIPAHAGKTRIARASSSVRWAHPRSRGENVPPVAALARAVGSSPLTRGKLATLSFPPRTQGLIPAHAGKTSGCGQRRRAMGAHPRSRGENYGVEIELFDGYGSSPLTRGKPARREHQLIRPRLIPAHAGKTASTIRTAGPNGAHPRSRGENRRSKQGFTAVRGSSPLTRGKRARRRRNRR